MSVQELGDFGKECLVHGRGKWGISPPLSNGKWGKQWAYSGEGGLWDALPMADDFDMDTLRASVRRAASRAGYSISRLDRELRGEGGSLVKDFLAGRSKNPQVSTLIEIADVLGISFYDVIGVDDRVQMVRTIAIEDALRGLRALLDFVAISPVDKDALLAALPAIAQAAQRAREGGFDVPSAVSALAQHEWSQSHPEYLAQ